MLSRHEIKFDNENAATAVQIEATAQIDAALEQLGIDPPQRTLVVIGGAGGMAADAMDKLDVYFREVVVAAAEALEIVLLTGGTDAGIMRMLGRAHRACKARCALLGVAAIDTVFWPGREPVIEDACALEPNHGGFLLVPGKNWGDESSWLSAVADRLSGAKSSLTLLVNGGEIAMQDVQRSVDANRPVVVLQGSGRKADDIAAALTGVDKGEAIQKAIASHKITSIDLEKPAEANLAALQKFF